MVRQYTSIKSMTTEEANAHRKKLAQDKRRRHYLKKNGLTEPPTTPKIEVDELTKKLDMLLELQSKPNVKKVVYKNGVKEVISDFNPIQEESTDEDQSSADESSTDESSTDESSTDEESIEYEPTPQSAPRPAQQSAPRPAPQSAPRPAPQPTLQPQQRFEPRHAPIHFV